MTPPPLSTIDRRIADLQVTYQRIAQNLMELDGDVTRQMLDASPSLNGSTAEQWGVARQRLSSLWEGQLALGDLLERVVSERGSRFSLSKAALGRLDELLTGPSVSVKRAGGQRSLTEVTAPSDAMTVDAMIARMSADYDSAMAVVAEVSAVWTLIVPRLDALGVRIGELESAADVAAARRPHELAGARRAIRDAEDVAHRDPLALSDDALSEISAMVDRAATVIRDAAADRQELVRELASATAELELCRRLLTQAGEDASRAEKVRPPEARRVELARAETDLAGLDGDLAEIHRFAEASPGPARVRLVALAGRTTELAERARCLATSAQDDLTARDELRGRLDAFRAKAHAVGRGEDLDLDRLYGEALDILYSAPCDLDRARALVVAYQQSINAGPRRAQ